MRSTEPKTPYLSRRRASPSSQTRRPKRSTPPGIPLSPRWKRPGTAWSMPSPLPAHRPWRTSTAPVPRASSKCKTSLTVLMPPWPRQRRPPLPRNRPARPRTKPRTKRRPRPRAWTRTSSRLPTPWWTPRPTPLPVSYTTGRP